MPGPGNISIENNIVATENDGIVYTENTSKDIVPTTSSVENNPLGTVSTENTSKDVIPPTSVEKNPQGTVNTVNDLMLNVPNGNVHTENTGRRSASQNCQPQPNLVELVRAAELKKTTENTSMSGTSRKRQP